MNITNILHMLLSLVVYILIYLVTNNNILGAVAGPIFYYGREVAQQEYHLLNGTYNTRAEMPWYSGFNLLNWTTDGKIDFIAPLVSSILLYHVIENFSYLLK